MGEIAEMMLDGTLCQQCGEYIGTDNGFPTFCAGCQTDEEPERPKLHECPECGRTLRTQDGLHQHIRAKHLVKLPF